MKTNTVNQYAIDVNFHKLMMPYPRLCRVSPSRVVPNAALPTPNLRSDVTLRIKFVRNFAVNLTD